MEIPEGIENITYLDNAATVFPKPAEVLDEMVDTYKRYGVNPGRSGYDLCLVGGQLIAETRASLANFFGAANPERLCFAYNASDALNTLIQGVLSEGDHVISTVMEHNSVLRPLNHLQRSGRITREFVSAGSDCRIDPADIAKAFQKHTKLVVVNHGSNVVGAIQPIAEIGRLCRERGILLFIDTAQTAGVVPIDCEAMCIDGLAFTGHKSLLGPSGIGGLWVREGVEVHATRYGGTGVRSANPFHLEQYPYRLEVGSPNLMGIIGLRHGLQYVQRRGIQDIHAEEMRLFARLQAGLGDIDGVTLHGPTGLEHRMAVLNFSVAGLDASDVRAILDVDHDIATRDGLHCAPLVHELLGTSPRGTVRMSIGPMNQRRDIDAAIDAVREIAS